MIDYNYKESKKKKDKKYEDILKYMFLNKLQDIAYKYEDDYYNELDDFEENYNDEENEYLSKLYLKNKKKLFKIKKNEKAIENFNKNKIPFRFKILESKLSLSNKKTIIDRLEHYHELSSEDTEYYKSKTWIDSIKKVPFNKYNKLNIKLKDGCKKINKYLNKVYENLDKSIYGHDNAKMQIVQIISKWISNPKSKGNVIALCGPMGNGKTTLVKKGISNAIKKPFSFLALGGAQDSSFLQGHDYTYEGAKCGRIVEMLIESKCMDPIIYFDELDKLSNTPKGEEISNLLCHITDPSQNNKFHDKYFSGIDFDLSKVLFIFSLNDESKINPILKDRITVIKMKGFKLSDKINIVKDYLIPNIFKEYNFKKEDLLFDDDILKYLISNYTKEEGVRQIKQILEDIVSKMNLYKLTSYKNKKNKFNLQNYKFPLKLTNVIVDDLLKSKKTELDFSAKMMYL